MRPRRRPADPFAVLGIAQGATRAEIRRAYRRRALEIHPDLAGADSTEEMAALNEARDRLLSDAGRCVGSPTRGATADEAPSAEAHRPSHPASDPAYTHAPTWDDYWAAWNDPPRRPKA